MTVPGPINETGGVVGVAVARRRDTAQASNAAGAVRSAPIPVKPSAVKADPVPREDVRELTARIAKQLEKFLKDSGRNVEYRVDADAGATVITVRRADTGEVVRQFPSEEALAWLHRLNEQSGTFLNAFA
jgi:flagellar protein FlaG